MYLSAGVPEAAEEEQNLTPPRQARRDSSQPPSSALILIPRSQSSFLSPSNPLRDFHVPLALRALAPGPQLTYLHIFPDFPDSPPSEESISM